MKGVTLLSDIFTMFMVVIVIIIISSLIWIFTEIYVVSSQLGVVKPREATIRIFYNPVKYESTLLAFLELEYQGISMKKILNAVAIQEDKRVWLPEFNKFVDVSSIAAVFFNQMLPDKAYILKIRDPEVVIDTSSSSSHWQKTSIELFVLDGKPVDLELYVG